MTVVKKANVTDLEFYSKDALTSDIDKRKRSKAIDRAIKRKYDQSSQPRLVLWTKSGYKVVKSRIIARTRDKVSLTGAFKIPVRSIVAVSI